MRSRPIRILLSLAVGQFEPLQVAALAVLAAAATAAILAGRPPRGRGRAWRYPMVVILIAGANVSLAAVAARSRGAEIGVIVLGSAVLLVYGAHRRMRAIGRGR